MFKGNPKFGFTLAEVLVTLGIIGVVSAMTIPSLTQAWQKQAYATQLKKIYSSLSQAAMQAIQEDEAIRLEESSYIGENGVKEFFRKNFKIVQECNGSITPCFASKYKTIDGVEHNSSDWRADYAVTTADGYSIAVVWNGLEFYRSYGDYDSHGYFSLQVDINGKKGPNVGGRDLFHLELYSDGKVAESYSWIRDPQDSKDQCVEGWGYPGAGCLSSLIQNGWTMDY